MSLKNLLKKELVSCEPNATVSEAANLMARRNVGAVLVVDRNKPIGIITDRDLVLRCICESRNCTDTRIEEIMTAGVESVTINQGIYDVIQHMRDNEIRRVPVVDEDGIAVGLLSFGDVFELLADEIHSLAAPASPEKKKLVDVAA